MEFLEIKVFSFSLSLTHKHLKFRASFSMKNTPNKFSYFDPVKACKKNKPDTMILTGVKFAKIIPN